MMFRSFHNSKIWCVATKPNLGEEKLLVLVTQKYCAKTFSDLYNINVSTKRIMYGTKAYQNDCSMLPLLNAQLLNAATGTYNVVLIARLERAPPRQWHSQREWERKKQLESSLIDPGSTPTRQVWAIEQS